MNDRKFIIGIVAATLLLMAGGVFFAVRLDNSTQVEAVQGIQIEVPETNYDWGEIDLEGGDVEKTFKITNEGSETLKLFNVTTSCMCTSARLSLGDEVSPVYGMHSQSSYVLEVGSGDTANLSVVFDPDYHGPSGVGPITRQVRVMTNDSDNPEIEFMLTANVTN